MPANANEDLYLGIDVGTSGIRAIVIDGQHNIVGTSQQSLPAPIHAPDNGIEQDANIWWQTLLDVLKALTKSTPFTNIKRIALDGTSATVLLADNKGIPLAPALMYNDARTTQQVDKLSSIAPDDVPVHQTSAALPKFMWLFEQDFATDAHYALHQADWLSGKLTGAFGVSDVNNCVKTGFDVMQHCWPNWLAKASINTKCLPEVKLPGSEIAVIEPQLADELGFNANTKIISGTTDSTAAFIATGARLSGDAVTSLGSTLVLKVINDQPIYNSENGVYSQPLFIDGNIKWLVGGASNSGGAVLRKYFNTTQLQKLSSQIDLQKPCSLNYYPLLHAGERFPFNDPDKQPTLTPRPDDDADFLYGIFDGIATIEQQGYQRLQQLGAAYPQRVITVGGGSVNPVWSAIRKNKLKVSVESAMQTEAAFGAALLAAQHS